MVDEQHPMSRRRRYTYLTAGATAAGVVLLCYVAAGPRAGGFGADLLAKQVGDAGGWATAVSAAGRRGGGAPSQSGRNAAKARLQAAQAYVTHPAVPRQAHVRARTNALPHPCARTRSCPLALASSFLVNPKPCTRDVCARQAGFLQPLHPEPEREQQGQVAFDGPGSFGSGKVFPDKQVFHSMAVFGSNNHFGELSHFKEGTHFEEGNTFELGASFERDAHFGVLPSPARARRTPAAAPLL